MKRSHHGRFLLRREDPNIVMMKMEFGMKDLGEAKKILGIEITRDRSLKRLCLTQTNC